MGGDCPAVVEGIGEAFAYTRSESVRFVHEGGRGEVHDAVRFVIRKNFLWCLFHGSPVGVVHLSIHAVFRVNQGIVIVDLSNDSGLNVAPGVADLKRAEDEVYPGHF